MLSVCLSVSLSLYPCLVGKLVLSELLDICIGHILDIYTMAFFGVTHLGYQNPTGDKMIVNPRAAAHPRAYTIITYLYTDGGNIRSGPSPSLQEHQGPLRCTDTCNVYHQPLHYSADMHQGSHERYKEMVKRLQIPRCDVCLLSCPAPHQLYIMPLTENQKYGWTLCRSPEPWTQVKRFPRTYSEMSK
ncbi:uncharacterized protein spmip11 [Anarhichas minor]|uniref:uncharacterized protein spmip11 n=1 Tax=Anarhichas minor TaxID=65739 RepID=UPI003F732292